MGILDFFDMLENVPCEFSAKLDIKAETQCNDAVFNDSNKHALTIGGATIDDLIDDDDRGGNFHMK